MTQDSSIHTDSSSVPDNADSADAQQMPAENTSAITALRPKLRGESTAVLSIVTAATKQPKDGTERLKPYRWAKGRSGNPGGRPKKLPLSEGISEVLQMPVSDDVRADLEAAVGKLPKKFTWADACSLAHMLAMFGKLKRFRLDIAREVREAVEGKSAPRVFMLDPPQPETKDDIKKKLWAWFGETEYERCKLYGMPVPEETVEMAKKMGVPLELPVVAEEYKK